MQDSFSRLKIPGRYFLQPDRLKKGVPAILALSHISHETTALSTVIGIPRCAAELRLASSIPDPGYQQH